MTPIQILKAARAKIEKPENWGKGRRGYERSLDTCCSAEAIEEVAWDGERQLAYGLLKCAAGLTDCYISDWNDAPERTHAEVLATFNLAIALARNFPRGA